MPSVKVRGGKKLERALRQARRAQAAKVESVEVGFFETARYPPVRTGVGGGQPQTPIPVATVAAWNEFGTKGGGWGGPTPERPFFRQGIAASIKDVKSVLRKNIDPKTLAVDDRTAGLLGETVKGHIQTSITNLREPKNSPVTIERKGSDNPLIDTGFMRNSVTWKINK